MDKAQEGSLLIATLIHGRLFDVAEDAVIGDVMESGIRSASFRISTPEDGSYNVWVSPSNLIKKET